MRVFTLTLTIVANVHFYFDEASEVEWRFVMDLKHNMLEEYGINEATLPHFWTNLGAVVAATAQQNIHTRTHAHTQHTHNTPRHTLSAPFYSIRLDCDVCA